MGTNKKIEERVARIEQLMLDLVEGRIRSDFMFQELERRGAVPPGLNELARKVMDRHRMKVDRVACQTQAMSRGVLSMRYGRRAKELDRELAESDKEILELARKVDEESREDE
jgi:hypothetical protein